MNNVTLTIEDRYNLINLFNHNLLFRLVTDRIQTVTTTSKQHTIFTEVLDDEGVGTLDRHEVQIKA